MPKEIHPGDEEFKSNERQSPQTTDTVVMVYPDTFKFNPETATSNKFMKPLIGVTEEETGTLARNEFKGAVKQLQDNGINVIVIHSPDGKDTPDAVFPNNWFSHHGDTLVLYPMRNTSRSTERQPQYLMKALTEANFPEPQVLDLTYHEQVRATEKNSDGAEMSVCLEALEGTGSIVLDRVNKVAFAIESPRTTKKVFDEWYEEMGYSRIFFHAENSEGPIYHTNVIMGIGSRFAVICFESIRDLGEREMVRKSLEATGREVIDITLDQVSAFCGNLLEVKTTSGKPKIVMSETALKNFTEEQIRVLRSYGDIIALDIPTIESAGGSARCIMAEIFTSKNLTKQP